MAATVTLSKNPAGARHPRRAIVFNLVAFLLSMAAAFMLNNQYIDHSYVIDDVWLTSNGPITWAKAVHAFDPVRLQWFYRPLFYDYWLFINRVAPEHWPLLHAISVALYGVTIYLLGVVAYRVTGKPMVALGALALYVLVGEQDEVLQLASDQSTAFAAIFSLLAILAWLSWIETRRRRWWTLAFAAVVAAMLNKEDAAGIGIILWLIEWAVAGWQGRRMIAGYIPLALWTIADYALCVIAYHHCPMQHFRIPVNHSPLPVLRFSAYRTLFAFFPNPLPQLIEILGVVGPLVLAWRVRRDPMMLALLAAILLSSLPNAIATGRHVQYQNRFNYVPNLYAALMWAILLQRGLTSKRGLTRAATAVLIGSALPIWWHDIGVRIAATMVAMVAVGFALWYARTRRDLVWPLLVGAIIDVGTPLAQTDPWWINKIAFLFGIVYFAVRGIRREGLLDGAVYGTMATATMPVSVGVVAVLIGFERWRAAWEVRRSNRDKAMEVSTLPG